MNYILFNSKSNNSNNEEVINKLTANFDGMLRKISVFDIDNYKEFFAKLTDQDEVTLVGGDGTINHFINNTRGISYPCPIYAAAAGTGNDFFNDVAESVLADGRVKVNEIFTNLPTVYVNGMERLFINGIGFGIDGYACEAADIIREKSPKKKIDYTSICIKGVLFHYRRPSAEVIIDGVKHEFKNVYLASSMKGRFYGGGMKVAPDQDRLSEDHKVTIVVMHTGNRFRALMNFPKIFKGELNNNKKICSTFTGNEVEVKFSRPTALQIDGETVRNVVSYKVSAK